MKTLKYLSIAISALAMMAVATMNSSCSSSGTGGDPDPDKISLTVDNQTIKNDGVEIATFTVKLNGTTDVTSNATITNTTDNSTVSGAAFSSTQVGTYKFKATYNGIESDEVTVEVKEESGPVEPEKEFYRKVALFRVTSTGCTWCPTLDRSLEKIETVDLPDKTTHMAIHGLFQSPVDPFAYAYYSDVRTKLGLSGTTLPMCSIDMRTTMTTEGQYLLYIQTFANDYKATTGFSVESSVGNNKVNVTVKVKATKTGTYNLGLAIIEDGLKAAQIDKGVTVSGYIHNNVLRGLINNNVLGVDLGEIQAGEEVTKEYSFDLNSVTIGDIQNCRLMVYTSEVKSGKRVINNSAYAAIEGETPYRYAD